MKKFTILFLLFIYSLTFANRQGDILVPMDVKFAFSDKYPEATNIKAEIENEDYEFEFIFGESTYEAVFTKLGSWVKTEVEIEKEKIPSSIKNLLSQNYRIFEVNKSERLEQANGAMHYEIELKNGKSELELLFDTQDNLLKEKIENEPGDDENNN